MAAGAVGGASRGALVPCVDEQPQIEASEGTTPVPLGAVAAARAAGAARA
jgi:hypothetical protein